MTYIDTRKPIAAAPHPAPDILTDAEIDREVWEVVTLARKDSLASLREPSRWSRAVAWAFGASFDRRLANPRLETLRRFAVLAWHHGYALPVSAIAALKGAGFSADQVERLLASIATRRTFTRGAMA